MLFNCYELNIIVQNLNTANRDEFIEALLRLKENTEAAILQHSIDSLIEKISRCSNDDIRKLYRDAKDSRINPLEPYTL